MGRHHHEHNDQQPIAFWARGTKLAHDVQQQLGDRYEVRCVVPTALQS